MEAVDLKGIISTLRRYYVSHGMRWRCNFHFWYVTEKILFTLQVYFTRSMSLKFSEYFSQFRIVGLFYWSKFRDRKGNEIFASQAKDMEGLRLW